MITHDTFFTILLLVFFTPRFIASSHSVLLPRPTFPFTQILMSDNEVRFVSKFLIMIYLAPSRHFVPALSSGSNGSLSQVDPPSADLEDEFAKCLADDWEPTYDNDDDENGQENCEGEGGNVAEGGDEMDVDGAFESPAKTAPLSPPFLDSSVSLSVPSPVSDSALRRRAEEAEATVDELRAELARARAATEKSRGAHVEEVRALEEAFGALKRRYDHVKAQLAQAQESDVTLRGALEKSTEQYARLKAHAQDKLRRANAEIVRLRLVNECQHAALYAKSLQSSFRTRTAQAEASAAKAEAQALRDALLTQSH